MAATNLGNDTHNGSMNGKPFHTHIPQRAAGGGGKVTCGICGEILMAPQS